MKTILLGGILAFCAAAQAPTEPPPILQLIRRPGAVNAPIRPYADARAAVDALGMVSITGLPEVWQTEMHQSFASIEDLDKAVGPVSAAGTFYGASDASQEDALALSRTLIAFYRPNWSYRADQAIRMFPRAHYFHITIYRVRPDAENDLGEVVKLRRLSADSVNLDRPDLAYQVISGAPSGTFIFLAPLTSLRTMDEGMAETPVYAEAIAEARAKTANKVSADGEISREHLLFRVEPRLSYVSDDFAERDPQFWRPKPNQ
jgi:hypothetical protein